jgi:ketosteroid isomerase-like protein
MAGVELNDMHRTFEDAFNGHDVERAMALYGPETTMQLQDGSTVHGDAAIRESLQALFGLPGQITFRTRYVIESGDTALLSGEWTMRVGDEELSAVTAEVAHRQADGTWVYLIDNPYAGPLATPGLPELDDANLGGVARNVAKR